MKEIEAGSVDFVLTDIPYGAVSRDSNAIRKFDKEAADIETFSLDLFLPMVYDLSKTGVCIFCGKEQFSDVFRYFAEKPGTTRAIIWEKSNPSPVNGQHTYLSGVELAVWFKRRGAKTFNAFCKNTVFKFPTGRSKLHPTEKNHSLLEGILLDNTNDGDVVLDPCMGSGSTWLVCMKNGRRFVGIEIKENYYNIAANRLREHAAQEKATS